MSEVTKDKTTQCEAHETVHQTHNTLCDGGCKAWPRWDTMLVILSDQTWWNDLSCEPLLKQVGRYFIAWQTKWRIYIWDFELYYSSKHDRVEYWCLEQRIGLCLWCNLRFSVLCFASCMHAACCERAPTRLSAVFCVRYLMGTLMCNQCWCEHLYLQLILQFHCFPLEGQLLLRNNSLDVTDWLLSAQVNLLFLTPRLHALLNS